MSRKSRTHWRAGCPCCEGTAAPDRRSLLLGSAAVAAGFLAAPTSAAAQGAAPASATGAPRSGNFVLRGGYVITMDGTLGDIPVGDVHVRDGAIAAIAPSVAAPDAEVIDAQGKIVMPGFIETHSHVWNAL